MSTVKSKQLQVGTSATSTDNFTIYQPATPDGTLRIGVGNADNPTEVGRFNSNGYVATNAPAFSAYRSTTQSISSATQTKIQFNGEQFDVNNCFDSTTNYRFTPNVAGYYQINSSMNSGASTSPTEVSLTIYKNGSVAYYGGYLAASSTIKSSPNVSALVYCNGTTDYIEIYAYIVASSAAIEGSSPYNTWITGHLVSV